MIQSVLKPADESNDSGIGDELPTKITWGSTGKQGAKPKKGPEEDYPELSALLSQRIENHASFDCHALMRRWAVLAFGWLCKGQKRVLRTEEGLLGEGDGIAGGDEGVIDEQEEEEEGWQGLPAAGARSGGSALFKQRRRRDRKCSTGCLCVVRRPRRWRRGMEG